MTPSLLLDRLEIPLQDGVYMLNKMEIFENFSYIYEQVRSAEQRIYDDETVRQLPEINETNEYYDEWLARGLSLQLLMEHFTQKAPRTVLEIGCGNGWLIAQINRTINFADCLGLDIFLPELKQAARVFHDLPRLRFLYSDIFNPELKIIRVDAIVLASCLQYFEEPIPLLKHLQDLLTPDGEIHILDTPLYIPGEVATARQRSREHYERLGFPEMAEYYYHHYREIFKDFPHHFAFDPQLLSNRLKAKFSKQPQPIFPWVIVSKGH